jgi:hypothetical protein
MTRARRHLGISYTMVGPDNVPCSASRFLRDLPPEHVARCDHFELTQATGGDTGGVGFAQPRRPPATPRPSPHPSPSPRPSGGGLPFLSGPPLRPLSLNGGGADDAEGGAGGGRVHDAVSRWRARNEELLSRPKAAKTKGSKSGGGSGSKAGGGGGDAAASGASKRAPEAEPEDEAPAKKATQRPRRPMVVQDDDSEDDFS